MLNENNDEDTERLSLRLPPGEKKAWKEKSRERNFGSLWKYLKYLVDNDIKGNEVPPRTVEIIEKLYAENHILIQKLEILTEKMNNLQELMATKTLIQKMLSEMEQQKIVEFIEPGKKLSEISEYLKKDEITTLGILDTLEGMGKIRLETDKGLWFSNE